MKSPKILRTTLLGGGGLHLVPMWPLLQQLLSLINEGAPSSVQASKGSGHLCPAAQPHAV